MDIRDYIFKMNIKTKALGGFIVLIIVSYLLYNFSITPLLKQRKRLRMSLFSQKRLLETRIDSVTKISDLETALDKLRKKLSDIEKKFLAEEDLPSFFAKLRSLADKNSVDILNLKVGEKQPLKASVEREIYKYERLPVDISLGGSYLNTIIFLAQLREEPAIFSVSKMFMIPQGKDTKTIKTDSQLILYLVYK